MTDVEQGSPAARAGLAPGDVILRVGRATIGTAADASRELGRIPSGGTAFLRVLRNGQETFVAVTRSRAQSSGLRPQGYQGRGVQGIGPSGDTGA